MEKFIKFIESVLNKYHKSHHNLSYLSIFIDGVGNKNFSWKNVSNLWSLFLININ